MGLLVLSAAAQVASPPALRLPPCAKAPVIDGTLSPGEWDGAFQGCGVLRHGVPRGVVEVRKARYWLTYDGTCVYVAVQTELPPWGKLEGKRRRIASEASGDDSLELFIDPARPGKAFDEKTYYQFLGNSLDTLCNFAFNARTPGAMPFNGTPVFRNTCADGWWTAEFSITAAELEGAALRDGETWGFNFCRYWHNPSAYSGWPSGQDYFGRKKYLQVTLDKAAPVIQLRGVGDPQGGKPGFDFALANPGSQALDLVVAMRVAEPGSDRAVREARRVTVKPGQRETVAWTTAWKLSEAANVMEAEVTSADGAIRYFTTSLPFDRNNARESAWTVPVKKDVAVVDMKAAFYPGVSRLRCLLNFSAFKFAALVTKAQVTVKNAAGAEIAKGAAERFADGEGELVVPLPKPLPEGAYTAELALLAGTKTVAGPVRSTFVKKNFPFEGNRIGVSDRVPFPWTGMSVQGAGFRVQGKEAAISLWNRTYTIGTNGLFAQIKSGQWDLLAGPAELRAVSKGAALSWRHAGVRITGAASQAVDFAASSECAQVAVDIACHSEFDGMFKYTVTLRPNGTAELDGLDLVVPLRQETAWLLHATSDGCRTSASMFTPPGEGRVWASTSLKQWRLTGSFIPYLWLGDDRAGLCWWADSEKGWVRPADKTAPAIEVRREKGQVQMVFHLIARPFVLKEPRTMVFAFNATPVRPRPSWARGWTMSSSKADGFRKGPHIQVYGSCAWVSFGKDTLPDRPYTYASLRPVSDAADAWFRGYNATNHAMGRKVIPYTDILSRAVDRGDELKHYASEWDRYNNIHPQGTTSNWTSNAQIAANMTPSRVDYDLWCMRHDAELGADGFYFDEIQTMGQLNPAADLGFVDEAGNWESECSLFAMRTYFKRLYTMLQDMGQAEPFIMPHSSSTMYAGPLAFTTIPMDLEMSSPDPDPNRGQVFGLGEGYALCNIMAFQHGFAGSGMVCPAPHQAYSFGDFRMARTFIGSLLLLDCHPIFGVADYEGRLMDSILGEFGYDDPGVQYVPYWRAGDLQQVGPDRVHVSLFRNPGRGGRALLVMYNDNPVSVTARWKPTAAFGLKDSRLTLPHFTGLKGEPFYSYAKDAEGAWLLHIPPYDYRLAMVGTTGTWGAVESWGPLDSRLFERNVTRAK